jgi:hypothetical protein
VTLLHCEVYGDLLLTLTGLLGRQRSQGQRKVISLLALPLREVGQLGFVPLQRPPALIIDSRQKIQGRGGQNVATYLSNTCHWCIERSERTVRDEIASSLSLNKSLVPEAFKNFKETQFASFLELYKYLLPLILC